MAGVVILIIFIVSAVVGFFIIAAAVAVGMILAQGSIDRRRAKEANRGERVSTKPSEVRARREAQKALAEDRRREREANRGERRPQAVQPVAQPPIQPPPQEPSSPSQWK